MDFMYLLCILLCAVGTIYAIGEYVLVEDITSDTFERQLHDELPETLELNVKRGVTSNVKLTLTENKRLNHDAPMYEVKSVNGQQLLKELKTSQLKETKFYHDKAKAGSFMVSCQRRSNGACARRVTGSLEHNDVAYEITPADERLSTRILESTRLSPHIMTRVIDLAGGQRGQSHGRDDDERLPPNHDDEIKPPDQDDEIKPPDQDDEIKTPDQDDEIIPPDQEVFHADIVKLKRTLQTLRSDAQLEKLSNGRQKRQSKVYAVEVVVVIDPPLWKKFYTDTEASGEMSRDETTEYKLREHFSQIINGVSLRYESIDDNELNICVTVTAILLYKTVDSTNPLPPSTQIYTFPGYPYEYVDGGVYLSSIRSWLINLSGLPDNDHVMVFTWYDLYSSGDTSATGMNGLAYGSSACKDSRVSVNEVMISMFSTISVAAHELGHNLGSGHDGNSDYEVTAACPASLKFVMAPAMNQVYPGEPFTQNPWRFSPCSVKQFKDFIQSLDDSGNNCLLDKGDFYNVNEFKTFVSVLPGERHTADEQCKEDLGQRIRTWVRMVVYRWCVCPSICYFTRSRDQLRDALRALSEDGISQNNQPSTSDVYIPCAWIPYNLRSVYN